MRRLRRAHQRHARRCEKLKRRAIAAGTAAVITFGAGASLNKAFAKNTPEKHQLPVSEDADADLLAGAEEIAIGYDPFRADQNGSQVPDGAELAKRCAAVIEHLPWEDEVVDCALIAIHYLEHGSFAYKADVRKGRLDVPALARALEIRFPCDPNEHQLPVDGDDLDGDLLTDTEELAAGYNLYDPDQDDDLTPDGIELARQCAAVIDSLPVFDPNGPEIYALYKVNFLQRGLEYCDTCGTTVNMGYWKVVNLKLGLSAEVPVLVLHYMEHGSFSYAGDLHKKGRIDVPRLVKILEMPRRCGDLGTIYLPGDLNKDCRVNLADFSELAEKWLECTDPNEGRCDEQ
jgi:hypothetical protein